MYQSYLHRGPLWWMNLVPSFRPEIGHARPVDVALPRAWGQARGANSSPPRVQNHLDCREPSIPVDFPTRWIGPQRAEGLDYNSTDFNPLSINSKQAVIVAEHHRKRLWFGQEQQALPPPKAPKAPTSSSPRRARRCLPQWCRGIHHRRPPSWTP